MMMMTIMIIKGSSRTARGLANHLLSDENETVSVLQFKDVVAEDPHQAIDQLMAVSKATRSRKGLYHASINLDREEAPDMTETDWLECVDTLEQHLGLVGHQRIVVQHVKKGRPHVHIVWCRAHPDTLKVASDSHNYKRHEQCSRELETKFGLRPVVGVFTRKPGTPRPVAIATHGDWQASERTGIKVNDVASTLQTAWTSTTTAQALKTAIEKQGLFLARGRRGVVCVDRAGTPHSISRRLGAGIKAGEIQGRLAPLSARLPTVEDIKNRRTNMQQNDLNQRPRRRPRNQFTACVEDQSPTPKRYPLNPAYWSELGYTVESFPAFLLVNLPGGASLEDYGDRLTLNTDGEPTDAQIAMMVKAGRDKGWKGIRFYGSEEFQRRARLEALRQGYTMEQITLECERDKPKPALNADMPEHIRRRLNPPKKEESPVLPSAPVPTTPTQEFRL